MKNMRFYTGVEHRSFMLAFVRLTHLQYLYSDLHSLIKYIWALDLTLAAVILLIEQYSIIPVLCSTECYLSVQLLLCCLCRIDGTSVRRWRGWRHGRYPCWCFRHGGQGPRLCQLPLRHELPSAWMGRASERDASLHPPSCSSSDLIDGHHDSLTVVQYSTGFDLNFFWLSPPLSIQNSTASYTSST